MTFSDDFITVGEGQEQDFAPSYPSLFGIKLTPQVSGILIALGLGALALYVLTTYVMPVWQRYGELSASRTEKQGQIAQKQAVIKQGEKLKTDLAQAKQQQTEILGLFANEKTLDTLLIDLNRLVESGNATQQNGVTAQLQRFVPVNQTAEVINDGSYGAAVNGKLKRRIVTLEFKGNYEQTQSILRNMERLQPLLIVRDYQSTLSQNTSSQPGVVPLPSITTSFQLQVLIPANPEEVAAAAKAAATPPK